MKVPVYMELFCFRKISFNLYQKSPFYDINEIDNEILYIAIKETNV